MNRWGWRILVLAMIAAVLAAPRGAAAEVPVVQVILRGSDGREVHGHGFLVRDWRRDDLLLVTARHVLGALPQGRRSAIELHLPGARRACVNGACDIDINRDWEVWPDLDLAMLRLGQQDDALVNGWYQRRGDVGRFAFDSRSRSTRSCGAIERMQAFVRADALGTSGNTFDVTVLSHQITLYDLSRQAEFYRLPIGDDLERAGLWRDLPLITYSGATQKGHSGAALVLGANPDVVMGMHLGGLLIDESRRGWSIRLCEPLPRAPMRFSAAALPDVPRLRWLQSISDDPEPSGDEAQFLARYFDLVPTVPASMIAQGSLGLDMDLRVRVFAPTPGILRYGPRVNVGLRLNAPSAVAQVWLRGYFGISWGDAAVTFYAPGATNQTVIERATAAPFGVMGGASLEVRLRPRHSVSVGVEVGVEVTDLSGDSLAEGTAPGVSFPVAVRLALLARPYRPVLRVGLAPVFGGGLARRYDGFGGSPPAIADGWSGAAFASVGMDFGLDGGMP